MWDLVGYPSGQRGQTVNLLAYAFDGSNPSPTTTLFSLAKHHFSPSLIGVSAVSPVLRMRAFVLMMAIAVFPKAMYHKDTNEGLSGSKWHSADYRFLILFRVWFVFHSVTIRAIPLSDPFYAVS